jgi:hypothetical protein
MELPPYSFRSEIIVFSGWNKSENVSEKAATTSLDCITDHLLAIILPKTFSSPNIFLSDKTNFSKIPTSCRKNNVSIINELEAKESSRAY